MNLFISCITLLIGGVIGAFGMALHSSRAYDRGYKHGYEFAEWKADVKKLEVTINECKSNG